jgi:hypothetical protein
MGFENPNNKLYKKYMTQQYINKWKYKFNKNWKLYKINEYGIEIGFQENIQIIENYFI